MQRFKSEEQRIGQHLRLLSYNIQVAIAAHRPHHYLTHGWKHLLPHAQLFENLDRIAELVRGYDVVGLQEVDPGSLRTGFVNQIEYLAARAAYPHWYHQTNRRFGHLAKHSNGVLSRYAPYELEEHKLPGPIPGRGGLFLYYGDPREPLVVVLLHLALGKRARLQQLDYVAERIQDHRHVVVMGDMNCQPGSRELATLIHRTTLQEPLDDDRHTFPSWRPKRRLDHILVSEGFEVEAINVLQVPYSDHLPVAMDLRLPEPVRLAA